MREKDARDLALLRRLVWTIADVDEDADFEAAVESAIAQYEDTQTRIERLESTVRVTERGRETQDGRRD